MGARGKILASGSSTVSACSQADRLTASYAGSCFAVGLPGGCKSTSAGGVVTIDRIYEQYPSRTYGYRPSAIDCGTILIMYSNGKSLSTGSRSPANYSVVGRIVERANRCTGRCRNDLIPVGERSTLDYYRTDVLNVRMSITGVRCRRGLRIRTGYNDSRRGHRHYCRDEVACRKL